MPFHESGAIRYFSFDLLDGAGVIQGVLTRQGGASRAPWASLNVGSTVGDDPQHVAENRQRSFTAVGRQIESLFDVWQVHGIDVVRADAPRLPQTPHQQADIVFTDRPEVTLFMRFADCVPIFLVDPVRKVVGLAHAGWQGTVKGVAGAAVQAMHERYGTDPKDILAGIGPSICPEHYAVGPEVVARIEHAFGEDAPDVLCQRNQHVHLDLWQANALGLERAGVHHVEVSGVCTACHTEDWYSHRAEKGRTGRFGALLALSQ
jgi:YfiH family protein